MNILNASSWRLISPARSLKRGARAWKIIAPELGRRVRHEHGSTLVEAALTLPLFVLVLTGIFSFAFTFWYQLTLTQAVGQAGQYLQQNRLNSALTDPCAAALTVVENSAPMLTASSISLSLNIDGTKVSANSCASDLSTFQGAMSAPVTVSATYPCSFYWYWLYSGISRNSSGCKLSAQVTEYEY